MTYTAEIAIVGGSLGGVAAALAALEEGAAVVLSEATDWLGGQMTSQGVAPLDEHPYIERFGGTHRYLELRERVRQHYREAYGAPATMPDGAPLNPGNGWVSRLCFEPSVGVKVLNEMLRPFLQTGQLTVLYEHLPVGATVVGDKIQAVELRNEGRTVRLEASYFLDATDLGDLLPLVGAPYVTGAEARANTLEPHARETARPGEVQSFTYSFAVEYRPGEDHTLPKPEGYERFRDAGLYALHLDPGTPNEKRFRMFACGPNGELPFWSYRRLLDAELLGLPNDLALINWTSNDYFWANLLDTSSEAQARILAEAKAQALGFLYWLQTEAPRDEGGQGYPELKLRRDVMGTPDGLSKAPYIRESRRIVPLKRVTETHLSAGVQRGARAAPFTDSVGVGWYQMDLHRCVGDAGVTLFEPTLPFQIPLGSLLPERPTNLLAACKNIGTTHLANGATRLHPVEWAVGEAAGTVAAYCGQAARTPSEVWRDEAGLRRVQRKLLERGAPIAWTVDVPPDHPHFLPAQLLMVAGAVTPGTPRFEGLELRLDDPLTERELEALMSAAARLLGGEGTDLTRMSRDPALGHPTVGAHSWASVCGALRARLEGSA